MSMQSLPSVGFSTGRDTDLSPAFNVTWSRLDTVCAPLWGKRAPSQRCARGRGGESAVITAKRGNYRIAHTAGSARGPFAGPARATRSVLRQPQDGHDEAAARMRPLRYLLHRPDAPAVTAAQPDQRA